MGKDSSLQSDFFSHKIFSLLGFVRNGTLGFPIFFLSMGNMNFQKCFETLHALFLDKKLEKSILQDFIIYFLDRIEDIAALIDNNSNFAKICVDFDIDHWIYTNIFQNPSRLRSILKLRQDEEIPSFKPQHSIPNIHLLIGYYFYLLAKKEPKLDNGDYSEKSVELLLIAEKNGFFLAALNLNTHYKKTQNSEHLLRRATDNIVRHGAPAHIEAAHVFIYLGESLLTSTPSIKDQEDASRFFCDALKHLYAAKFLEDDCKNENTNVYGQEKIPSKYLFEQLDLNEAIEVFLQERKKFISEEDHDFAKNAALIAHNEFLAALPSTSSTTYLYVNAL